MSDKHKVIRDSIHGDIKIDGLFVELLESPEMQRLYNVKQLGFAHLVFPGAHHTRLEHSLGSYHMAVKSAETLNLRNDEKKIIETAAILHDIGHGPFSHTLESLLRESFNVDHVDITEKIIFGEYEIFDNDEKKIITSPSICEILEKHDVDKKQISNLIKGKTGEKKYLSQLLNGPIDVDQLDYISRDAYYTGVAYGMIDIERFLQTLTVHKNNLMMKRKGVGVVENILMARALMYSSVYFHKTVRIAELMLSKAIGMITDVNPMDFFKMTDDELINYSKKKGSYQYEIITRLKYRKLFKQAYTQSSQNLSEENLNEITKMENPKYRREKEKEIEEKLSIPHGHIIIDVPRLELHLSEPRLDQTNILVFENGEVKKLEDLTPTVSAIKSRAIPDWVIMIITDEKYRHVVSEKAEKIIFN